MAKNKSCAFRTSIGGQALIEGILMRGPDRQAIVVRKPDGSLEEKVEPLHFVKERYPILGLPLIRGVAMFLDSMVKGMRALLWSAEFLPEEEQEQPSRFDLWLEKTFGSEKAEKFIIGIAVVLGIALSVGLFMLLPTVLTGFLDRWVQARWALNLIEGGVRITIFLVYLWLCSRMQEIHRLFSYHGAEHKTIYCYEKGLPLTVENVRKQSRFHPRCGTSFLLVVILVSILVLFFVTWSNVFLRLVIRLALLPLIVGISYEINRWLGRHDDLLLSRVLSWPGRQLQHLTTSEPDDSMIEVAIAAMERVIPEEKGKDAW